MRKFAMLHRTIIGDNIRIARKAKCWSQETLAHRANINAAYLSEVERGQENISIDKLQAISHALGVPLTKLVKGVEG